jgi:hypothetical protein
MKTTYFLGIRAHKAAPTKHHVPALWECMLGTVYARNAQGETRYFDYNHDEARAFAGILEEGADLRVARAANSSQSIHKGQYVLWIRRPVQSDCT